MDGQTDGLTDGQSDPTPRPAFAFGDAGKNNYNKKTCIVQYERQINSRIYCPFCIHVNISDHINFNKHLNATYVYMHTLHIDETFSNINMHSILNKR